MFLLTAVLLLANEKEIAMGRAINADLRRRTPPVNDAQITAYVAKIGARFQQQSPVPLTVEVTSNTNKRQVSALAGGFVRVPLGALLQSESEVDLAFTIAHAVAHLAKRHHLRQSVSTDATIPLVILDNYLHGDEDLMPRPMAARHQEAEREADALASQWTMDYEATGEFEAIRQRARQLLPPPRKQPTLRRASERRQ